MNTLMNNVEKFRNLIKNWWVPLLLGVVFLIFGFIVFLKPGESYLALSFAFGIMIVASGVMETALGFSSPPQTGRGWHIAGGIIEILIGIVLLSSPVLLTSFLPFFLGFWLMLRGFGMIGVSSDMMDEKIKGAGWVLFFAILLVISAFLIIINPIIGMGAAVIWVGISLLVGGISLIISAFHLRSLKKFLDKLL